MEVTYLIADLVLESLGGQGHGHQVPRRQVREYVRVQIIQEMTTHCQRVAHLVLNLFSTAQSCPFFSLLSSNSNQQSQQVCGRQKKMEVERQSAGGREAFVTLLSSRSYYPGVVALARSLRQFSARELLVLTTPGDIPEHQRLGKPLPSPLPSLPPPASYIA